MQEGPWKNKQNLIMKISLTFIISLKKYSVFFYITSSACDELCVTLPFIMNVYKLFFLFKSHLQDMNPYDSTCTPDGALVRNYFSNYVFTWEGLCFLAWEDKHISICSLRWCVDSGGWAHIWSFAFTYFWIFLANVCCLKIIGTLQFTQQLASVHDLGQFSSYRIIFFM